MKNEKVAAKKQPVRVAVVVWMKPSLKAKLKKVAKKEEKSLSSVIRESLAEAVG